MGPRLLRSLNQIVTLAGLLLVLAGGAMWWRQSRTEAALLSAEDRALLAMTAPPGHMPSFDEAAAPDAGPVATRAPTRTPTPSATLAPDETPRPTASPTPDIFPPATEMPTTIVAPAIGLDAPIVEMSWEVKTDGTGNPYSEWVVPAFAAGWHRDSAFPGNGSNTVLSAHHNTDGEIFRYIVDLEPGDEVRLRSGERWYRYIVEEKVIVQEKDQPLEVRIANNRYIQPTDDERLTLVSCWPYETNTHRVIVIARPADDGGDGADGGDAGDAGDAGESE